MKKTQTTLFAINSYIKMKNNPTAFTHGSPFSNISFRCFSKYYINSFVLISSHLCRLGENDFIMSYL